jgi:hypothetical protein
VWSLVAQTRHIEEGRGNNIPAKRAPENGGRRTRRAAHVATRLVLLSGAASDEMAH